MKCTRPFIKTYNKNEFGKEKVVYFPCGKCLACRINKKREWSLRLQHEVRVSDNATFVTLTYEDKHLPLDENGLNCPSVSDLQYFIKKLRRRYTGSNIRYMINSEYGPETKRVHYHGIIFNLPKSVYSGDIIRRNNTVSFHNIEFEHIWGLGNVEVSEAVPARCNYVCSYFVNKQVEEGYKPNISVMSRGYGIGKLVANSNSDRIRYYNEGFMTNEHGTRVKLPRYYKNLLYTEDERKAMFEQYLEDHRLDLDQVHVINHSEQIEENRLKALKFNSKKHKL